MPIQIDDAFIRDWNPKYSDADEGDHEELVTTTAEEMRSKGTISKKTFHAIWNWKGAMRVIRHVVLDEYDTRYAEAFRRAASEPPTRKLNVLLEPGVKLPGVGAPNGFDGHPFHRPDHADYRRPHRRNAFRSRSHFE
jgi:hypothetical protein